ncbi:7SK snRNA methylphosphate capping enzyme [Protopterus annectens]|uniref:7SK snRNA methylphosphate capping enzyme n=1 Tax=Protopterus annectens TaxID=7888 RepID=UPI001CFB60F1|nr:7SK snRNA methylphosphate capping enzyme [Protopterus annectens]
MIEMSVEKEAAGENVPPAKVEPPPVGGYAEVQATQKSDEGGGLLFLSEKERVELDSTIGELPKPRNGMQPPHHQRVPKRRSSFNTGFRHPTFKRRRRANSDCDPVLPSKFLLGGNIFDPLNLNSLLDEEVNRKLNAETPKSSPLPVRNRDPVEILIPKDITDPLNLNSGDGDILVSPLKLGRKRHRHRHHTSFADVTVVNKIPAPLGVSAVEIHNSAPTGSGNIIGIPTVEGPQPYELNTVINCRDEIVSPILPSEQAAVGQGSSRHRKRRRTPSKSESGAQGTVDAENNKNQLLKPKGKPSFQHQHSHPEFKSNQKKFQYGNYSQYYGYRNPARSEDQRLKVMNADWFEGKRVLDLGCNVGHVTLGIAKNCKPSHIVGIDIDGGLIYAAKRNIRHYLSEEMMCSQEEGSAKRHFPVSMTVSRGPIAAPPVPLQSSGCEFPNNITFIQANYVLKSDELLDMQKPEYDVILCLSLTKWVHLNWGDDGLKRMFKRIYRQLIPGGLLVLEPQPWCSYGKRKKLTETIYKNYCKITFKPDQFIAYLLSDEVGFVTFERVGTPSSNCKGFRRPIYLFHKSKPLSSEVGES